MGCVPGITVTTHYCIGGKLLQPYGGRCQCQEPGCAGSMADPGPAATPARRRRRA
ncbi:hypothetical protein ABZ671_09795 [Micromonospora sp. NPDC006766]|uniref:hypothetical protein n=1 Tax=Micromonospora sp. NPDC006766 TaxID=3154778 RepID=UPI0033D5B5B3